MTIKKYKGPRNPVAQALYEDRAFKLKINNPKKRPPKEPTLKDALIELELEKEEDIDNVKETN